MTIPGSRLDLAVGEMIGIARVTPDYHQAMGIPLRRGRWFTSADRRGTGRRHHQRVRGAEVLSVDRIRSAARLASAALTLSSALSVTCTSSVSRSTR